MNNHEQVMRPATIAKMKKIGKMDAMVVGRGSWSWLWSQPRGRVKSNLP